MKSKPPEKNNSRRFGISVAILAALVFGSTPSLASLDFTGKMQRDEFGVQTGSTDQTNSTASTGADQTAGLNSLTTSNPLTGQTGTTGLNPTPLTTGTLTAGSTGPSTTGALTTGVVTPGLATTGVSGGTAGNSTPGGLNPWAVAGLPPVANSLQVGNTGPSPVYPLTPFYLTDVGDLQIFGFSFFEAARDAIIAKRNAQIGQYSLQNGQGQTVAVSPNVIPTNAWQATGGLTGVPPVAPPTATATTGMPTPTTGLTGLTSGQPGGQPGSPIPPSVQTAPQPTFVYGPSNIPAMPQQTPLSGPMGPVDLAQSTGILIPQADKYIIGPGDLLTVRYSSPIQPPQQVDVVVDVTGAAIVPVTGRRVVVRGMRLDQFNKVMTTYIRQGLRDAQVESMFKQLRSISVNIIGESFAPGTYLMPSTVSLFNALYISGGPSENGSLRDIELRHADGTVRRYDMYQFLVYGRGNLDMDLQPGDAIYIPPAKTRVAVGGEVGRPAIYEMLPGEGLSTALRYAEGVKPTGVQKISIISVRPGQEHVIIDASAAANQRLYNGDSVEVYSVRSEVMNEVSIEGAVLTPRQYAISKGMRVADLVAGARGLRREAYVDRADLFRKNPDGTFKLISINLSAAIKGDPTQNVLLMPFDRLHVYTVDEVMSLGTRKVTSQGAVRFPATLYRADNMTVRDVILQSGGLALNAYQSLAYLQRMNPDGTPGPLLKVNLIKALQGDPRENILVQDQDILRVMTVQEQAYIPDQVVTITGAVQRPGNLTLHQGMTIRDMLGEAGGPLDNAYLPQAFLQRRNPDGTVGPIITIDVAKAMAGDPGNNIPLQPFDTFAVYNLDQARFKVPEFVRLEGGVQRPGMYQSSPNMTLKDAIVLAGGPLPTIGDEIQLQHAYQPRGEKPIVLKASDWQGETGKYHLQAGDTITIPERNDLIDKPGVVFLTGDVSKPGPYVLTGDKDKDRLSTIIKQAGGLTKDAFPEGAQITRDPKLLQNDTQRNLAPRIANVFSQMEAQEYERARALVASDRLGLIFKNGGSNINPGGSSVPIPVPSGTSFLPNQPTTPLNVSGNNTFDMALAQLLMTNGASPARTIDVASLTPVGAMPARLDVAMAHIRSEADITLKEGDIIYVPDRPTTIVVSGSVVAPKPMPFERNGSLGYYIQRAGGTTQDADMREAIVIRASGQVMRVNSHSEIKAGDVIFIPSKVLINRLQTNNIDLTGFASSVGTALTTAVLLKLIIG